MKRHKDFEDLTGGEVFIKLRNEAQPYRGKLISTRLYGVLFLGQQMPIAPNRPDDEYFFPYEAITYVRVV